MPDGSQMVTPIDETLCGQHMNQIFGKLDRSGVTCPACIEAMRSETGAPA